MPGGAAWRALATPSVGPSGSTKCCLVHMGRRIGKKASARASEAEGNQDILLAALRAAAGDGGEIERPALTGHELLSTHGVVPPGLLYTVHGIHPKKIQ